MPALPESMPFPGGTTLTFWRDEIDRATRTAQVYYADWDENVQWYTGQSPDAVAAVGKNADFVNVNVDFYQVEQKLAQLFYQTPEVQLTGTGTMAGQSTIIHAHRLLLNAILGEDHIDILTTVHLAIKDCLCVSGTGAVMLGYEPTIVHVQPPEQFGAILGLQGPIPVPIHERFYAERFSPKKLLIPADFHGTDWDMAPWLGMRFRTPVALARRMFQLPPEFTGTTTRDDYVLDRDRRAEEATARAYVDGQTIWYRAHVFEDGPVHPELYRELVLIDGLAQPARHRDSPHQTIGPRGRMTADSLIGNPIHPLTIRTVPDSAYVPSDSKMTRPLVRELCKFRTQMVQERDANKPRILYDIGKLPPEVIAKIEDGSLGALIGIEEGGLASGVASIMAQVVQGTSPRQTYIANDYIEKDIAKTLALGANQTSVQDEERRSATEVSVMDRAANVRLDAERRQVIRWYLKLTDKVSALVCRYLTPQMAVPYIGPQRAQAWAQWDKTQTSGRVSFSAKPDSQIRLDAAAERKFAMDLYNFTAKDPNINRVELLKSLFTKAGLDPAALVVEQLPEKKPEPQVGFTFKGDDLVGPAAPIVREIIAQAGYDITPEAFQAADNAVGVQIATGQRDVNGQVVKQPMEHGGPAEKTRPLSQQQGDLSGERSGPKTGVAA